MTEYYPRYGIQDLKMTMRFEDEYVANIIPKFQLLVVVEGAVIKT